MDKKEKNKYLLLQVNDTLFPIGGYSHSYGLETYIQKELVADAESVKQYIHNYLLYNFCYTDMYAVKQAYWYAQENNLEALEQLDQVLDALKAPAEIRTASQKLGTRFVKTVQQFGTEYETDCFARYCMAAGKKHHTTAYGTFAGSLGADYDMTISNFLYGQLSAMITNCVKLVPLSQTVGQKLLSESFAVLEQVKERLAQMQEEEFGMSCPGFDIRCMQHEGLYSRLYMS